MAGKINAQGTIEFIVILGAALFFFTVFFAVIQTNITKKNLEKERVIAQNIALDVQYEINLAAEASEGYVREFKIPESILGKDYEIQIGGNSVYVSMEGFGVSYTVSEVVGSIQKGPNVVKKQGGEVLLN